jgi:hypothetical protein
MKAPPRVRFHSFRRARNALKLAYFYPPCLLKEGAKSVANGVLIPCLARTLRCACKAPTVPDRRFSY